MDIKQTTVALFTLFFILCSENASVLGYSRAVQDEVMCKEKEKEALLSFKQGLIDPGDLLASWGSENDKKECCDWYGVRCSNMSRHVVSINLQNPQWENPQWRLRGGIRPALLELQHLEYLNLEFNDFGRDKIPEFIGSFKKLKVLSLSFCNLYGEIPYQLGNLTNLQVLDLSYNDIGGKQIPGLIGSLKKLEVLNIKWCGISGKIPYQLRNLTNLRNLSLSGNDFGGVQIPDFIAFFKNLEHLDLRYSNFSGDVPFELGNLTNLRTLDLSYNNLTSKYFNWLSKAFPSLKTLYLRGCIQTKLPMSIFQLFNLEALDVSDNDFEGTTISEFHLSKLVNLKVLGLSSTSLTLNLTLGWIPPFQLNEIGLEGCIIGPRFPTWLQSQINLSYIYLSSAGISDQLPNWLWDQLSSECNDINLSNHQIGGLFSSKCNDINFSNNQISGSIPDLLSNFVTAFNISSNNFSGPLPLFHPNSTALQLSRNMFSGSVKSLCSVKYNYLEILDLSMNLFTGELPNCWQNMPKLMVLNLAGNKFSGYLPHSLGSLRYLGSLIFRKNSLTGVLPSTLRNCSDLKLIDGSENALTGDVPTWIGALTLVSVLTLRHNNFHGSIPREVCGLSQLHVLDLSHNSISGAIPQCFDNFTHLLRQSRMSFDIGLFTGTSSPVGIVFPYLTDAIVQWKMKDSEYKSTLGLLRFIDLSSNKLVGDIPREIFLLSGLSSLNLSWNYLTGNVDSNIDQMKMIEILDLSRNNLSGEIPTSLAELDSLSVLNLSNNSLSGKIPRGTQLQSFNASAYAGNKELCGDPLPNCQGDRKTSAHNRPDIVDTDKPRDEDFMTESLFQEIYISGIFGYIVGLWVVIGPLLFKRSWRDAYFVFWNKLGDWLYLTVTICGTRFRNTMSRKLKVHS